jgi:protein phosphatase
LLIEAAVEEANGAILERAKRDEGCARMGTTVVVGVFGDRWMSYTHVGDSRLYRLRESRLEQLTNDHSLIQEVVDLGFFPDLGEARRYGINGNVLTRAVGSSSRVAATTASTDLRDGDIFLFCTDGLTGSVNDDALQFVLAAVPMETRLDVVANALVHLAYQGGASDNVTLALARVRRAGDDDDEQGGSAGGDTIASAPV